MKLLKSLSLSDPLRLCASDRELKLELLFELAQARSAAKNMLNAGRQAHIIPMLNSAVLHRLVSTEPSIRSVQYCCGHDEHQREADRGF